MSTNPRLRILSQPDDTTCGPTCLHAVYRYWGDDPDLDQIIREVVPLETKGTLAVFLACHALRRGYRATIYTYNLHVFDPSWFSQAASVLPDRLRAQARAKPDPKLRFATTAYLDFLVLGGELRFEELTLDLIQGYLATGRPILSGVSATYLYGCPRERDVPDRPGRTVYDDIRGTPMGHFVVLSEYDPTSREVIVADPIAENPRFEGRYYRVGIQRVLGAILLGVLTYDANFLVVEPAAARDPGGP